MIICQCAVAREAELTEAMRSLKKQNPKAQINLTRVFRNWAARPTAPIARRS